MEESHISRMNKKKINVYKEVRKDVDITFNEAEEFINERIEEIWSREKHSAEEVI